MALPQHKELTSRKNSTRGKTLQLRIDGWDELEGPVQVSVWSLPITPGDHGLLVFDGWVHSEEFSVSLSGKHEFPVSVGGKRMPQDIGDSPKSKETGKPVSALDPSTWPEETFIRGAMACTKRGYCVHEERTDGKYRCPKPVVLPGGLVTHAKETWVIRADGRPAPESKLAEARKAEKLKDAEITERVNAERRKREQLPPTAFRHADPGSLNIPFVMGGSGPVE